MRKFNTYKELNKKGELIDQQAERRYVDQLHEPFLNMEGYKRLSDHVIELQVSGKTRKIALFRLVPEGNDGSEYIKRVQIKNKDLDFLPDEAIVAYINDDSIVYLRPSSTQPLVDLPPKNPTTYFRVSIHDIKRAWTEELFILGPMKARGHKIDVTVSKDIEKLFDDPKPFKFIFNKPSEVKHNFNEDKKNANISADKEIGYLAEKIAYNNFMGNENFKKQFASLSNIQIETVEWVNEDSEKGNPYDLVINKNFFIEIKGSKGQGSFVYTERERKFGVENNKNYILIKFNNIANEDKYDFPIFYTPKKLGELSMNPMQYIVKEGKND